MARYGFTFTVLLLAALSRLLPHPPNFAPITAIALFGGMYLDRKHTFLVPIAALLISDYFLGFYAGVTWVYASFLAIGCIGLWMRNHPSVGMVIGGTLAGSVLFFIVTNFGMWLSSGIYPHTSAGFVDCYIAAIPFFRNTLLGDALYVTAMFGLYELAKKFLPALQTRTAQIEL